MQVPNDILNLFYTWYIRRIYFGQYRYSCSEVGKERYVNFFT
jgi:hypothetical protein